MIRESKRRSIPLDALVAIGYVESRYRRGLRGSHGEFGLWQLGATKGDHSLATGWHELSVGFRHWPIVKRLGGKPWASMSRRQREAVLDDISAGTYLVALELWTAKRTCYRMRNRAHRAGGKLWPKSRWYSHRGIDVYGHYNVGNGPPTARYLGAIRSVSAKWERWMK